MVNYVEIKMHRIFTIDEQLQYLFGKSHHHLLSYTFTVEVSSSRFAYFIGFGSTVGFCDVKWLVSREVVNRKLQFGDAGRSSFLF